MKVSVIVPVYNVSKYVGRCVESLMNQTLRDMEIIFVDDCCIDNSMDIVRDVISGYPERQDQIRILRHETNRGLPSARNTGLREAVGDFIYHCDSDDFLESDMLSLMADKATKENLDMVYCDFAMTFDTHERIMTQPDAATGREALSQMLKGSMKYNVWNKLCRRTLYNGIEFPDGKAMGEDMTMIRVISRAGKVARIPFAMYHYVRPSGGAMSQSYDTRKRSDVYDNAIMTVNWLLCNVSDKMIERETEWFKLNVKLPFLFTGRRDDIMIWREWFREADRYIMCNRSLPIRTRLLQWCAAHHLSFVNLAYYRFVFSLVYGK